MMTTTDQAADAPSWFDRHVAATTTGQRRERPPWLTPGTQGAPAAGQTEQEDHDEEE